MAAQRSLLSLVVLLLVINWPHVESKTLHKEVSGVNDGVALREKRFAVDPLSAIGLAVSVASAIQSAVCTFSSVCGGDEVTQALERMEEKLDAIQNDVTSIRHDVEEIWNESKRKWYFKHIDNIIQQRKAVIADLKNKDYTQRAKDKQTRFILEVFGTTSKDEYVEKALLHIPKLVTDEGLVTHYFDVQIRDGKSVKEAAKLTWAFIRKIFRYQEDGYASIVFAASMKYKDDEASYNSTMSEVCAWWPKSTDPEYKKFCKKFVKDTTAENRRKSQEDFLYVIRDLALIPVQLVQTDCNKFADSNAVHFSEGHLYVSQPQAKKILIVDPKTLDVVKALSVPGSECGGNCHPIGVSIKAKDNLMAIGAKSSLPAGESKVMLFKIKGDLTKPSGISIEHYYTMLQLFPVNRKDADVRDVAFCGNRFGYADYNGVIYNWRMPDELYYGWNDGKPVPDLYDRNDWSLRNQYNVKKDHQYYLGCSNSRRDWLVEKTNLATKGDGVGAVPSDFSGSVSNILEEGAENVVLYENWHDVGDGRSRMNNLKGLAMDSKRNFFYSSGRHWANGVCGVYQRTYDGKRRYIREWNKESKIEMFGMAVDESGFLFSIQKHGSKGKCLYKFHHEIDLEDINVP